MITRSSSLVYSLNCTWTQPIPRSSTGVFWKSLSTKVAGRKEGSFHRQRCSNVRLEMMDTGELESICILQGAPSIEMVAWSWLGPWDGRFSTCRESSVLQNSSWMAEI